MAALEQEARPPVHILQRGGRHPRITIAITGRRQGSQTKPSKSRAASGEFSQIAAEPTFALIRPVPGAQASVVMSRNSGERCGNFLQNTRQVRMAASTATLSRLLRCTLRFRDGSFSTEPSRLKIHQ
jgi:hypothetical protein